MSRIQVGFVVEYHGADGEDDYEISYDNAILNTETSGIEEIILPNSYDTEPVKQHWILMPSGNKVPVTFDTTRQAFRIETDAEHWNVITYEEAKKRLANNEEVYCIYDSGGEGLAEDLERIEEHHAQGGRFGIE